jgi:aldehyde dehydrogenase (NAD+)
VPVIPFNGEDEAIRIANDTTYGLPSGIQSGYGREQGAEALENYTQYKTVWANLGGH